MIEVGISREGQGWATYWSNGDRVLRPITEGAYRMRASAVAVCVAFALGFKAAGGEVAPFLQIWDDVEESTDGG